MTQKSADVSCADLISIAHPRNRFSWNDCHETKTHSTICWCVVCWLDPPSLTHVTSLIQPMTANEKTRWLKDLRLCHVLTRSPSLTHVTSIIQPMTANETTIWLKHLPLCRVLTWSSIADSCYRFSSNDCQRNNYMTHKSADVSYADLILHRSLT